jgi:hypothetical protein
MRKLVDPERVLLLEVERLRLQQRRPIKNREKEIMRRIERLFESIKGRKR